ncbi:puratrophin-1-like isoform X2 [Tachypleus tridentatus]
MALLLMYFHGIPKKEVMKQGFLVLVDCNQASNTELTELDEALYLLQANVNNPVSSLLIWTEEEGFDQSYFPKSRIKYEVITSEEHLHRRIKQEHLLPQTGGSYFYDHQEWVSFRKSIEPFINGCCICGRHLVRIMQKLCTSRMPSSATLTSQLIEHHKQIIGTTFQGDYLRHLEEEGYTILKKIVSIQKRMPHNVDYRETVDRGTILYRELQYAVRKLTKLVEKRQKKLETCLRLKRFEEESSQVLGWLCWKGEETLSKHQAMADSFDAVKEQEGEFEKFYFLAMRQIEKGNDLMEEASTFEPMSRSSGGEHHGVQTLASSLAKHLYDFTERLDDTRERLEDSTKCYSLLDRAYEWAVETMKFVSCLKIEKTTSSKELIKLFKSLQDYIDNNPPISEEIFHEIISLATRLENESLLEQCKAAQVRCQVAVDLIKAKQATFMKARQQMELEHMKQSCDLPVGSQILHDQSFTFRSPQCTSILVGAYPGFCRRRSIANTSSSYSFPVGSYTSFPSNHLPIQATKENFQLDLYMEEKEEQLLSQGLITEDLTTQGPVASISRSKLEARASSSTHKGASTGGVMKNHSGSSLVVLKEKIIGGIVAGAASIQSSAKDGHSYHRPVRKLMRHSWQPQEDNLQKFSLDSQTPASNQKLHQELSDSGKKEEGLEFEESPKLASTKRHSQPCGGPVLVNSHLTRTQSIRASPEHCHGKQQHEKTKKQLKLIMREMIHTERDYVNSLEYIIENYIPELLREDIPQALRGQRNVIFGNLEKIFEFHKHYFLNELQQCNDSPFLVGQCFLQYESQFYLYALYNKNKPKSDSLMVEYANIFFKKKQLELGDKMDLSSYLLKPVQRMGKYALLLKQLLKECPEKNSEYQDLKAAEEMVHFQLRHGNDLLAMDALRDCDVNVKEQGRLLRQGEFIVWQGRSRKSLRRVFLFEDLILFSKARQDFNQKGQEIYQYKHSIKTSDIGMTEQVGDSPTRFEIWFRKRKLNDTYILQAPSPDVKYAWVQEISKLLWKQALRNREMRLAEMSSMGIGNKPCLDIKPSEDQINDRLVMIQQDQRVPRFKSSVAVSSCDQLRNNKRPHSIISVSSSSSGSSQSSCTAYGTLGLGFDSCFLQSLMAEESQLSSESGVETDVSIPSDCLLEVDRPHHKKPERSDSILSNDSIITNSPSPVALLCEEQLLEEPRENGVM